MKFATLDLWIIAIYCVGLISLATWVSKSNGKEKTSEDYFLAGRSLPWWAIGASLIAANISAEQIIGMSGQGYVVGMAIATYELTAAIALIVMAKYFLPIFLEKKIDGNFAGKVLLGLAQTFEDQIVPANEQDLIPYFFDNNIFFEDPFQIYSSISRDHLSSSLELYDSMLVSLKKSPLLAEAYFKLGEIKYRILQDFDQAYMLFNRALKNNPDKKLRLKIILRISDVLIARGQSKEAQGFLKRQLKQNPIPSIELKKILVHFLIDDPDSTIQIVNESMFNISPLDGSFNDLMELKNFLTKYYSTNDEDKVAFTHFLKAEHYLRQKKIGDAIRELVYINTELKSSTIIPLTNLRLSLLYYRLKDFDNALKFAFSLDKTEFADKGIILSGQIYENKILDIEKALVQYMRILDEYPSSIFSEPIRYHIRDIKQLES